MGTKKETTTSNVYDPKSMAAFQNLLGAWAPLAQQFIQNPFGGQQFQQEQRMGTRQAQLMGGRNLSNLLQNQVTSGFGGGATSPFMQEMLANQSRANTGLQAELGFENPVRNALARQFASMQLGAGYQPLQTGQQQVQKMGGLGTWLPQVAGLAMNFIPGMGGLGGAFGSMFSRGGGEAPGGTPGGGFGGTTANWLLSSPSSPYGGIPNWPGTPPMFPPQGGGTPPGGGWFQQPPWAGGSPY